MRPFSLILALTVGQLLSLNARSQTDPSAGRKSVSDPAPNDTTEDLKLFLQDALADARDGKKEQLDIAVSQTEIPHFGDFFRKTWPEPGESWVAPYGEGLHQDQLLFKKLLTFLSHQDGEINIRSVNKNPEGGRGMEWGMLESLAVPLDIYYASFKVTPKNPEDQHELPIGYFYFIDNGFRLDTTNRFLSRVVHSVPAVYPYPLEPDSPKGAVQLVFLLNPDGTVNEGSIQATHRPQMTTDAKLIQAAKEAVGQYQYMPPALFRIRMGNMMETVTMPPGTEPPDLGPIKINPLRGP